jgi:ribosomal protein S18 acetylase RimI-like enzyme
MTPGLSSPITYRPATASDQKTITAIIRAAGINRMGLHWQHFLLAVDAVTGEVVGTGQIKSHGDGSRELASIATRPAYRGQGIAREIIRRLVAEYEAGTRSASARWSARTRCRRTSGASRAWPGFSASAARAARPCW